MKCPGRWTHGHRETVSSHQPCRILQGSALHWKKAPSAACVKEMEGWAGFKELHLPLEGEEQEDETVVEMGVPLRQFLHQAATEC